jgi:hypothetical protein
MISFPNLQKNIENNNGLLSMLGVNLLIDSSALLPEEGVFSFDLGTSKHLPIVQNSSFELGSSVNDAHAYYELVSIKPDTYYLVILDYDDLLDYEPHTSWLYLDLYDTISDSFVVSPIQNKNHSEFLLYSGNQEKFLGDQYIRVVTYNLNQPVKVSQLNLYEIADIKRKIEFNPIYNDGENRVFENANVRDILYFPEAVKGIDDIEYLFENTYSLKLDKINYVLDAEDRTFDLKSSSIKNINFKHNTISCVVESKSKNGNFVNFSQNYFPGWRVYIDGKRAELKQVNALIMGVYVPPGIHTVKFSFISMSFIFGLITTCSSVIACIVLFGLVPYFKRKKSVI